MTGMPVSSKQNFYKINVLGQISQDAIQTELGLNALNYDWYDSVHKIVFYKKKLLGQISQDAIQTELGPDIARMSTRVAGNAKCS